MKKIILIISVFFAISIYGQEFEITKEGMFSKSDHDKKYIVLEFPEMDAKTLYQSCIKMIYEEYKNPDEVIKSKIDNEYLRFDNYIPQMLTVKNSFQKLYVDTSYTTELRFKDGKIRLEITDLEMTADGGNPIIYQGSSWKGFPIYDKKGKLKLEEVKNQLETYFNDKVRMLKDYLPGKKKEDYDEW